MPRRRIPEADSAAEVDVGVERHRLEQLEGFLGFLAVVERQGRIVTRVFVARDIAGLFFLQVAGVGGGFRAIDGTLVTALHQHREIPRVVDMRVRQHDCVDGADVKGRILPVALTQILESLKQAAVDQDVAVVIPQHVPGSGDRSRRAVESYIHIFTRLSAGPASL